METLRLLTALQQRGGRINLSALKPLEPGRLGKTQVGINVRGRGGGGGGGGEGGNFCTELHVRMRDCKPVTYRHRENVVVRLYL